MNRTYPPEVSKKLKTFHIVFGVGLLGATLFDPYMLFSMVPLLALLYCSLGYFIVRLQGDHPYFGLLTISCIVVDGFIFAYFLKNLLWSTFFIEGSVFSDPWSLIFHALILGLFFLALAVHLFMFLSSFNQFSKGFFKKIIFVTLAICLIMFGIFSYRYNQQLRTPNTNYTGPALPQVSPR